MVGNKDENNTTKKSSESKINPIYDDQPTFKYKQFLGIIMILGFLIIGSAAGSYGFLKNLMEAPCLGCLGLYPSFEIEFTFNTVDGKPHPDWILDALDDGPVFIEFTQDDINCPPCARMRPKVHELEDEYSDTVVFFIINVNHNENAKFFKDKEEIISVTDSEETKVYNTYDVENVGKGRPATPTYIIFTFEKDEDGTVKPYFAVGYGEFKEEDAQKTKEELAEILDFAIIRYNHNIKIYQDQ
jgi:thiol-disulfide isomerase/thioredoxin